MNKEKILTALINKLEVEFKELKAAALATYEDATHEETKPENEYDTRALEASYLAGAQAERAAETAEVLSFCQSIRIRKQDKIGIGAIATVEHNGKSQHFLILPKGGGISVTVDDQIIHVMTPTSPLGQKLIGLGEGEVAELKVGSDYKDYEVLKVY